MIGGFDENDSDSWTTTEMVDKNGAILGPNLPWGFTNHCVAKIDEVTAIIIGGSYKPSATLWLELYYDHFNSTTEGPKLNGYGRINHACATIRADNGSIYVIAAGGLVVSGNVVLDTSEILSEDGWHPGK